MLIYNNHVIFTDFYRISFVNFLLVLKRLCLIMVCDSAGTDGGIAVQYYSAYKMNTEIQKWTWPKLRPFFVKNQNYDVRFSDFSMFSVTTALNDVELFFIIKNNRIHMVFAAR